MSTTAKETALMFLETLENDSRLSAQYQMAAPNGLDGVVDFASSKGYIFTIADLEAALKHDPHSKVAQQLRQFTR
jgi:hypothetical protein